MNYKKIFLIILVFSFLFQIFAYTYFKNFEPRSRSFDVLWHHAAAKKLLTGNGLTVARWYPPGYSLYLSVLYKLTGIWNYRSPYIHIFSLLLLALTVAFCFVTFSRLFDVKTGLISASIFCVHPLYLFLATRPGLSEHLFFFVFYFSLWLCILGIERKSLFAVFLSGLLFGYASATKYNSLLYPLIIFIYILFDRSFGRYKKLLFAVSFLFSYMLIIIPCFIWLLGRKNTCFSDYLIYILKVGFKHCLESKMARIISVSEARGLIEFLKFLFMTAINNPSTFFITFCKNLGRSWYSTSLRWHNTEILLIQIPIILSAAWGLLVGLTNRIYRRNLFFCLFSILYFWFLTALTGGIVRVMLISMPFVFVFSALGIMDIYKRIYSKLSADRPAHISS